MYLILENNEAKERNRNAGIEIGLKGEAGGSTLYRWQMIGINETTTALNVEDGDGLTEDELKKCVEKIEIE